jgi:hypothetical protein
MTVRGRGRFGRRRCGLEWRKGSPILSTRGMAGVLHKHPDITIPKLEELLAVELTEA